MNANILYRVESQPHPFDAKQRKNGVNAYCLIKAVRPEIGFGTEEPVAIFNFDSEAELFLAHVHMSGVDGKLIELTQDQRELYASLSRHQRRR